MAKPKSIKTYKISHSKQKVRIYFPYGEGPFPVIVYYHGGGFIMGDIKASDPACRDLCCMTGMVVISVNYRLAPENPFPSAVEDSLSAFDWVWNNLSLCDGNSKAVFVGGDSAGGNLAAVVAQQRASLGLAGQILFYPVVDFSDMNRQSYQENTDETWLSAQAMHWFRRLYLTNDSQYHDVKASPLLASHLNDLPPAIIFTAEFDPLRDEAELYADRLQEAGIAVTLRRFEGEHHGFYGFFGPTPVYKKASQMLIQWLTVASGKYESYKL